MISSAAACVSNLQDAGVSAVVFLLFFSPETYLTNAMIRGGLESFVWKNRLLLIGYGETSAANVYSEYRQMRKTEMPGNDRPAHRFVDTQRKSDTKTKSITRNENGRKKRAPTPQSTNSSNSRLSASPSSS